MKRLLPDSQSSFSTFSHSSFLPSSFFLPSFSCSFCLSFPVNFVLQEWAEPDAMQLKTSLQRHDLLDFFFFNYAWIDSLSLSPLVSSLVSLSVCLSLPLSSLSFLYPLSPLHPRSTPLTLLICFVSRNESSFTKIDWIQPDWRGRRNESPSRPVAQSLTDWPGPLTRHLLLLLLFAIISGYFESWFLSRTNSDWPISLSPLPRSEIVTVKEKPARRGYRWLPRLVNFKWIPFTTRTQKIIDFLFLNDKGKMKGRKEGRKERKERRDKVKTRQFSVEE